MPTEKYTMKKVNFADLWKDDKHMQAASMGLLIPDDLAKEVFPTKTINNAELFLYLFRRFGPPIDGIDMYKEAASYTLTTPMDGIYLRVIIRCPNTWGMDFGYAVRSDIADEIMAEWTSGPTTDKVKEAIRRAIEDLARPTYTRDVYFNMFGYIRDDELEHNDVEECSTYKGLAVAEYYGAE